LIDATAGRRPIAVCCEFEIGANGSFVCNVERWRFGDVWRAVGSTHGGMAPWFLQCWPIRGRHGLRLANRVGQCLFAQLAADPQSQWHRLAVAPKIPLMQSL
jgi:hypothetical protein